MEDAVIARSCGPDDGLAPSLIISDFLDASMGTADPLRASTQFRVHDLGGASFPRTPVALPGSSHRALRRTFSGLSPLVSIVIAVLAAGFQARGVTASTERLRVALDQLRDELPVDRASSYRTQRVREGDPRAPWLLAVAARSQGWLVVMGLVRLGSLPLELINLVDEPHRELGLVPADDRLVLAHLALAGTVIAAGVGALVGRRWIARLEVGAPSRSELVRSRTLTLAAALSGAGALGACATAGAMMAWTPMSLYWLREMAGQSVVYAVCASIVAVTTVLASRAIRRARVIEV